MIKKSEVFSSIEECDRHLFWCLCEGLTPVLWSKIEHQLDGYVASLAVADAKAAQEIVAKQAFSNPSRGNAGAALIRQVASYVLRTSLGWRVKRVSEATGRDRTTVSHSCRLVEDLRDDDQFDGLIAGFEAHSLPRLIVVGE